jgi:hypothetical protein
MSERRRRPRRRLPRAGIPARRACRGSSAPPAKGISSRRTVVCGPGVVFPGRAPSPGVWSGQGVDERDFPTPMNREKRVSFPAGDRRADFSRRRGQGRYGYHGRVRGASLAFDTARGHVVPEIALVERTMPSAPLLRTMTSSRSRRRMLKSRSSPGLGRSRRQWPPDCSSVFFRRCGAKPGPPGRRAWMTARSQPGRRRSRPSRRLWDNQPRVASKMKRRKPRRALSLGRQKEILFLCSTATRAKSGRLFEAPRRTAQNRRPSYGPARRGRGESSPDAWPSFFNGPDYIMAAGKRGLRARW